MEIHFQHQKKLKATPAKMKARENNKFIGVRQRPSGRWVAEIKDTTKKIRMWLGTFETAQEAARAYDEAACLLRGPNTRTNFLTQVSHNSPLASRIRNLLNTKKTTANQQPSQDSSCPSTSQDVDSGVTSSCTTSPSTTADTNTSSAESFTFDTAQDCTQLFDDVYKPDLSNCDVGSAAQSGGPWGFDHVPDRFSFAQELSDLPRNVILSENSDVELSEFERMKVERQISASLYAINGLHEYMESVYDPSEPLWDLPPLCSLLS